MIDGQALSRDDRVQRYSTCGTFDQVCLFKGFMDMKIFAALALALSLLPLAVEASVVRLTGSLVAGEPVETVSSVTPEQVSARLPAHSLLSWSLRLELDEDAELLRDLVSGIVGRVDLQPPGDAPIQSIDVSRVSIGSGFTVFDGVPSPFWDFALFLQDDDPVKTGNATVGLSSLILRFPVDTRGPDVAQVDRDFLPRFASLSLAVVPEGSTRRFFGSAAATLNDDQTISFPDEATVIPLPAGVWLLLSGLGGLAVLRRRASE